MSHGTALLCAALLAAREAAREALELERAMSDAYASALEVSACEAEHARVRGITPERDEEREELARGMYEAGDRMARMHYRAREARARLATCLFDFDAARARAAREDGQ